MTDYYFYPYKSLTGGGDGALDSLDGSLLKDGDAAFCVVTSTKTTYVYVLDDDSAATESSPTVISPDSNAGDKRWVLTYSGGGGFLQTGTGAVVRTSNAKIAESFTVEDFGATGDGTTDDVAAIQLAVDAMADYSTLIFSPGKTYKISESIDFTGKEGITIIGYGATITGTDTRFDYYFDFSGTTGTNKIYGLTFDLMFGTVATYIADDYDNIYNVAIRAYDSTTDIEIYNCTFTNLYTHAVDFRSLTGGAKISDCYFSSPAQDQDQNANHVYFLTCSWGEVFRCRFINSAPSDPQYGVCGIQASNITDHFIVDNCVFDYCGRDETGLHRLGVIDFYQNVKNVSVTNNSATNCQEQFMRLNCCTDGIITGNRIEAASDASAYSLMTIEGYPWSNPLPSGYAGSRRITISDNLFIDESNRHPIALGVLAYDWGLPSNDIKIHHNSFIGATTAIFVYGPYSKLLISENVMSGYLGAIKVTCNDGTNPDMGADFGTEANSVMEYLTISGNIIIGTDGISSKNMIFVDPAPKFYPPTSSATDAYEGTINVIKIINNKVVGGGTSNIGVAVRCKQDTPSSSVFIEGNNIDNCPTGYYVVDVLRLVLERNVNNDSATTAFFTGSGVTNQQKRFNLYSNAVIFGTVALVDGSASVSTAEIKTGDTVLLTRTVPGGTVGTLSISAITDGTSFSIASTSGTDTSTIFWEIYH